MNNPYIGIIGTVIGAFLGFTLTWLKGYIDERKKVIVEIQQFNIEAVPVGEFTFTIRYYFDMVVTNNSIVKQSVWGICLDWEKLPDKTIVPAKGSEEFTSIKIDSKSVQHYECWGSTQITIKDNYINLDELKDKNLKIFYRTSAGVKEKIVKYNFIAKIPPQPAPRN